MTIDWTAATDPFERARLTWLAKLLDIQERAEEAHRRCHGHMDISPKEVLSLLDEIAEHDVEFRAERAALAEEEVG